MQNFSGISRYRLNPIKKEPIRICSFSEGYTEHLMLSHYTDGNRGIILGFEIDNLQYEIEKVNYNRLAHFNFFPKKFSDLKTIFLYKINDFSFEKEYQIITKKEDHIKIDIKKVFFGAETMEENKKKIYKLSTQVNSEIIFETYYG